MNSHFHGERYRVSELIRLGLLRLKHWDPNTTDARLYEAHLLLEQAKDHLQRREFSQSLLVSEAAHLLLDELRNTQHADGITQSLQVSERFFATSSTTNETDILANILVLERAAKALRLDGLVDEAEWMTSQAQHETDRREREGDDLPPTLHKNNHAK